MVGRARTELNLVFAWHKAAAFELAHFIADALDARRGTRAFPSVTGDDHDVSRREWFAVRALHAPDHRCATLQIPFSQHGLRAYRELARPADAPGTRNPCCIY